MAAVSVVIPTYNGARFIAESLASVFAQTLLPREIIVVDDASNDNTVECVKRLVGSSPAPMRIIRLPANSGGPARPTNVGIRAAASEFIAVLDQDDVFVPAKLERQAQILQRHAELSFVFCLCGRLENPQESGHAFQTGEIVKRLQSGGRHEADHIRLDNRQLFRWLFLYDNFVVGYPAFLFRRVCWERRGVGIDERIPISTDHDFLRWLCLCGPAAYVPERLFLRRAHDANLSDAPSDARVFERDVIPTYRRFLDSPWLFEERAEVPQVRQKILQLADGLRGLSCSAGEQRWLRSWLEVDPAGRPALREHLLSQAGLYREMGDHGQACRLVHAAGRLCGWNRQILRRFASNSAVYLRQSVSRT